MGLFDFLRRNRDDPPAPGPAETSVHQPRCHHYTLAHHALRTVAFRQPLGFLSVLVSPNAQRFLKDLMRSVSENCREEEAEPGFAVEDLTIHTVRVGRYPCAVIEMPPPKSTTEAFFVAAVLLADVDQEMPDPEKVAMRYFTLEQGSVLGLPPRTALEGPPRTVLGEWTADGAHCNYGDGPAPRLESFIKAVEALLS